MRPGAQQAGGEQRGEAGSFGRCGEQRAPERQPPAQGDRGAEGGAGQDVQRIVPGDVHPGEGGSGAATAATGPRRRLTRNNPAVTAPATTA